MQYDSEVIEPVPGVSLFVSRWQPDGASVGTVVLAHGIAEHSGRYRYVGEKLADAGWTVVAPDHRGHGRSSGRRGDLRDLGVAAADLDAVISWGAVPERPVVLLGHSMGSLIAALAVIREPATFDALVLSGTALDVGGDIPGPVVSVLKALGKARPTARLSPPIELSAICSDPAVQRAYDEDPLVDRGRARLGTVLAILSAGERIREGAAGITVPTLLVHGAEDELTKPSGAEWLRDHHGGSCELVEFAGRHEILNEPNRDDVIDRILEFLGALS